MSDSPSDIPAFAALAADPEIAPLLDFEPVVRKVKRPDGWTPELQRELIARLAATGTLQAAVWQMGKHATGAEALYKTPCADSFRASWDEAIIIGRRRGGLDCAPPFTREVPGITRRASSRSRPQSDPHPQGDEEVSDDMKFELIERLATKFLRKIVAEREARLAGEIVAADFYLRQITHLEVMFDLMSEGIGLDPWHALSDVRRGGHGLLEIADTPFARYLDAKRRDYWASSGEPMRPVALRGEYLIDHGDHITQQSHGAYGALTVPARGHSEEQWAGMGLEEQIAAREAQCAEDAADQISWEAQARAEFEERSRSS